MDAGQGLLGLRAGCLLQEWEGLCGVSLLMRLLMGSLNHTVFVVFLKLLGGELPQGGEVQCGKVIRGPRR